MALYCISLPKDNREHDAIIEWWYFNGHLQSLEGKQFAFMDCFFKADSLKSEIPVIKNIPFKQRIGKYMYFAHSVLTDIDSQKSYKDVQPISLISNDSFTKEHLFINYINPIFLSGYTNNEIAESKPGHFHIKTESVDLELISKKAPLLEGGEGLVSVLGRESFYYSLTDLETKGTITIDGKKIEVTGKMWMDHQWADVSYGNDTWSWFSMQFEDGTDIMCVEYGKKDKVYLVDIINPDGSQSHYKNAIVTPGTHLWKSPDTKAQYPQSWTIKIPEADIVVQVRAMAENQEMVQGTINYWEGPIEIIGKKGETTIKGKGFMELVGYPTKYNPFILAGKNLRNRFKKSVSTSFRFQKNTA